MLVLSRKQGQSICLPRENVTITILRLSKGKVRLGIAAPDDVLVMRDDVTDRVREGPAGLGTVIPIHV